ncbi:MAG: AAA family ATPase, partial [Calditerrivibrio sp.]|nr:AAA family ATPase [Calditerrivibrio sp.]
MFLSFLSVQNFSVIGDVELDFTKGLNVFTGETGAGKTLIVNAIKIVLGDKLNKNFFRDEDKPIRVQGVFTGDFSGLPQDLVDEFEIGEEIIVRREVYLNGKNKVSINGILAPLKTLQNLTENFVDIHGQHEHQLLLNPRNHLIFIDSLVDDDIKSRYITTYRKWKKLEKDICEITSNIENANREKEFLEYKIQELVQLKVDPSEDSSLNERIEMLSNIDKIRNSLTASLNMINFDEINVYNLLTNISKELGSIAKFGEEFSNI